MLGRQIFSRLLRPLGPHIRLLGSFHSEVQPHLRRKSYQVAHDLWLSSPCAVGFRGRFYATTQNDIQKDQNPAAATNSDTGSTEAPVVEDSKKAAETAAAELKETIAKHGEEMKEAKDKYLRALAETENVRQRLTRQIGDAKQFGIQSFAKDLLEVSDILSKAMESIPKDAFKENNPHFANLFEGLRLTDAQMSKVFNKHGLEKMNPLGEKFNPNEHEALFEAPADGKETGTVLAVTQSGFKLNNRVVRPARVGVVRNA